MRKVRVAREKSRCVSNRFEKTNFETNLACIDFKPSERPEQAFGPILSDLVGQPAKETSFECGKRKITNNSTVLRAQTKLLNGSLELIL